MILWVDGAHDPAENMRRDRALLEAAAADAGRPRPAVLRLFRFDPPGITLGRSQRPERDLDRERCRRDGVPWAVRPTGGRAIFHAEEWTYSLAAAVADPDWGGSLAEAYARASRLILASLVRLGVPAELAARCRSPRATRPAGAAAAACFASTARHEILLSGRKLVGSAQRRRGPALLQQGSVLLGPGHLRLADYLPLPPAQREATREALRASSAQAGIHLDPHADLEHWAEALARELPPDAPRYAGGEGLSLLTLPEARPYTPSSFEAG